MLDWLAALDYSQGLDELKRRYEERMAEALRTQQAGQKSYAASRPQHQQNPQFPYAKSRYDYPRPVPVEGTLQRSFYDAAQKQTRYAPGTTPRYQGLANQIIGNEVGAFNPMSNDVIRTLRALLIEQGSSVEGLPSPALDPNKQVSSEKFYRTDGTYDWGQHNAARELGLEVV